MSIDFNDDSARFDVDVKQINADTINMNDTIVIMVYNVPYGRNHAV